MKSKQESWKTAGEIVHIKINTLFIMWLFLYMYIHVNEYKNNLKTSKKRIKTTEIELIKHY